MNELRKINLDLPTKPLMSKDSIKKISIGVLGFWGFGVLGFWDSRWLALALLLGAGALATYGILQGDWNEFVGQWQTSKFVHVMSLDFCALSLLFPTLVGDDLQRRGGENSGLWVAIACFPLLGALIYLLFRPSLFRANSEAAIAS